jgi:quercetin dioxygenase-like cupin family protein
LEERDHVQTVLPADLEALVASAVRREGVIWSLETGNDLNANLVRFGAGRGVGEHVNDEVDVVFVGVSGTGFVEVDGREHALHAGKLVFVPKGARRSTRGASEDFAYLTVHGRRGPLRIGVDSEPEQKRRR